MDRHWTRALVTGASSGIGEAVARQLAAAGTDLVLVARNREALDALAGELGGPAHVEVLVADLADPAQLATVEARLADGDAPVDLLVNNAGFGVEGRFADRDIDGQVGMIEVNVVALVRLAHAAARAMRAQGRGAILDVSSVAGFIVQDGSAVYGATKAFVTAFSEALAEELRGDGVTVTTVCPGLTHTDFHRRAGVDTGGLPDALWQDADEVARVGLEAAAKGRGVVVSGLPNKAAVAVTRVLPRSAVSRGRRLIQRGR